MQVLLEDDTISYTVYESIGEIPDDLFLYLVDKLTYWQHKWLMRPCAEQYRQEQPTGHPVVVAFARGTLRFEEATPVGWNMLDNSRKVQMFVADYYRKRGIATNMLRTLAAFLQSPIHQLGVYGDGDNVRFKACRVGELTPSK